MSFTNLISQLGKIIHPFTNKADRTSPAAQDGQHIDLYSKIAQSRPPLIWSPNDIISHPTTTLELLPTGGMMFEGGITVYKDIIGEGKQGCVFAIVPCEQFPHHVLKLKHRIPKLLPYQTHLCSGFSLAQTYEFYPELQMHKMRSISEIVSEISGASVANVVSYGENFIILEKIIGLTLRRLDSKYLRKAFPDMIKRSGEIYDKLLELRKKAEKKGDLWDIHYSNLILEIFRDGEPIPTSQQQLVIIDC